MSNKEFMKVYHMPFKAQEIKDDNFTNFTLQCEQAFEEMTKSFSKQQDEIIINYLYEKYKDTKVSDVWVLSKPDFEKFLLEMLPKWKGKNTDIIDNYMAFKIDNANPSEALECLEYICKILNEKRIDVKWLFKNEYTTIKQALLKAQEQEKENELLKEIIKSLFDRGCPLHQYIDKDFGLTIEVDDECSILHLGEYKGINLDEKLKEVLDNE